MKKSLQIIIFFLLSLRVVTAWSAPSVTLKNTNVVTKVIGSVGDYYLTSREVIAGRFIEKALFPNQNVDISMQFDTTQFVRQLTAALLERVVSVEAENFSIAHVDEAEMKEAIVKIQKHLSGDKNWLVLDVLDHEMRDWIERKLRAKKFLKYKTESATLGVTDEEVKEYFDKNRYKFGNLPLQNFQDNIKSYLIKQQMEERLKEWFEILKKKYKVRNYLTEKV